jgi:hypothetical protein
MPAEDSPETKRMKYARSLLKRCESSYTNCDKFEDIASADNTVATYRKRKGQKKYTHMFFAKQVSCWRRVRKMIDADNDGPVVSVGAGPCLCLLGWFWDIPPDDRQRVIAYDLLRWKFLRGYSSHKRLVREVLGPAKLSYESGRYFPEKSPPQAEGTARRAPIAPDDIPKGSTVLLPYVLNHVVGCCEAVWLMVLRSS